MNWGQTPIASKRGQTPFARKRGLTPNQRGATLVELIAAIAVIAMAGAALVGTLSYLAGHSSETTRQAQAQAIADAWLVQITGRPFADVLTYDGLVTTESGYRVRVNLTAGGLAGIPNNAVRRIDVSVDYDTNASVIASGFRTNRP